MEIKIRNAILHVLNNDIGTSLMSQEELDIDSETCYEFITRHVKKLLSNHAVKEATFNSGSRVYEIVSALKNGQMNFKDASREIGERLFDVMLKSVEIPSADVLVTLFNIKSDTYLAVLKLNYKECFMHEIRGEADAQLVKCRTVLPFDGGKVDEACLIPYEPMVVKLIEKQYPIDGEERNYFSELFLECSAAISKKDVVSIIKEVSDDIIRKYYEDDIQGAARVKNSLVQEAEEGDGSINFRSVATKAFGSNPEIVDEYVSLLDQAGLKAEIEIDERYVRQQFGTQRIKADNGVEVKLPSYLLENDDAVRIINNSDGTISIHLNRLCNLTS
ncbi:MAG: nucleoid-associated protein [Clostridiales bacterium]|jgi:hypothetical protein|nr:nucleoid-associated protein [Clostridiales bacterium]